MSDAPEPALPDLPIAEHIGEIQPFPRPVVWTVGLVIGALAAFGLYEGAKGVMSGGATGGGESNALRSGDAMSAAAAAPVPSNGEWSTLNGPAMSSAVAQKAASSAPAKVTDNTDNTDDQADSAAAAPPPAAVSAARPVESAQPPTPPADSSAQSGALPF